LSAFEQCTYNNIRAGRIALWNDSMTLFAHEQTFTLGAMALLETKSANWQNQILSGPHMSDIRIKERRKHGWKRHKNARFCTYFKFCVLELYEKNAARRGVEGGTHLPAWRQFFHPVPSYFIDPGGGEGMWAREWTAVVSRAIDRFNALFQERTNGPSNVNAPQKTHKGQRHIMNSLIGNFMQMRTDKISWDEMSLFLCAVFVGNHCFFISDLVICEPG